MVVIARPDWVLSSPGTVVLIGVDRAMRDVLLRRSLAPNGYAWGRSLFNPGYPIG